MTFWLLWTKIGEIGNLTWLIFLSSLMLCGVISPRSTRAFEAAVISDGEDSGWFGLAAEVSVPSGMATFTHFLALNFHRMFQPAKSENHFDTDPL